MTVSSRSKGERGEDLAAEYLEAKGYLVLERNYSFMRAEVDLVCFHPAPRYEDGGEIVFVEVKTRGGEGFGRPEEAVQRDKRKHVARAAEAYLHERKLEGAICRFDVVSIYKRPGKAAKIDHFENAFMAK